MDWVLRSPQFHSIFSNLGYIHVDGYHVNDNCNSALEAILHNILVEDKYLRTYRRSISFGQNIQKDIIPLLIHTKDDKTVELIIKILVNLTIPIECLLNIDVIAKTDFGRHTIFDINNLLAATKIAFTELRASKALVDFLRRNVDVGHKAKLSEEQRTNANNCLLLLRNVLHIPENIGHFNPSYNGSFHSIQNQIIWNIFSQSIDKIIIKSMTISDANFWGVTMVQLIALLFKDQHVMTLNKLLNNWLETALSESSEDNESNTSPPDRAASDDSSPMLTSSDSSDNGGKDDGSAKSMNTAWDNEPVDFVALDNNNQIFQSCEHDSTDDDKSVTSQQEQDNNTGDDKSSGFGTNNADQMKLEITTLSLAAINNRVDLPKGLIKIITETSDCGYGTQIENHESVSTSSNDDDLPTKKPVHQKPHNAKQRPNNKPRLSVTQGRKRKKVVKRGKANIINVQGLSHNTPTDADISNVLKEFTVDFLTKGYNSLVQTLYNEILTNKDLQIDTSHFFWLVTYFLKFATQIECDLELVESVLSFEIVSYLISEGVNLCEQFELAMKFDGSDLLSIIRKQHLVVTSIREFVQAIELYKKVPHLTNDDHNTLKKLQIKMCETEDLRSLLVLLLRHYNPKYHSKQYLQDLIVTNHILLMFLDNTMKIPDYNCSTKMIDHIRQFATTEVMAQYGLLLDDYLINGEFVNDCIFTLMHHVGGEMGKLITLFQPNILKTFTAIWKSDFEICDDWSDLIEYVINTFVKKPSMHINAHLLLEQAGFLDEIKIFAAPIDKMSSHNNDIPDNTTKAVKSNVIEVTAPTLERWTQDEISSLSWNFLQCSGHNDVIGSITKQLKEDAIDKTRVSVIKELFRQNLITRDFYESQLKGECDKNTGATAQLNIEARDEEIKKLCEELKMDGNLTSLEWVQKVLLEICYAKLYIDKKKLQNSVSAEFESKLLNFEIFRINYDNLSVVSPIAYHSLICHQSVPLVPWNCEQGDLCMDHKFLQLLHKLGFQMPIDTGMIFIRIPHFWTADFILDLARKIIPIDTSKMKFSINELSQIGINNTNPGNKVVISKMVKGNPVDTIKNLYQVHKQNPATMVNFTPRPAPSFRSESKIEHLNWLDVVKKSQECRNTLNLKSFAKTTENTLVLEAQALVNAVILTPAPPPVSNTIVTLPTISTKQESTVYKGQSADQDLFISVETASVASDFSHMYVSDEDEKVEVATRPPVDGDKSIIVEKSTRIITKISGKRYYRE